MTGPGEIDTICPHCRARNTFAPPAKAGDPVACAGCGRNLYGYATEAYWTDGRFEQCPVCGAEHLYRQRDFNRKIGVGLVVVGALLAPFTYGISLIGLAAVDFVIYRSVGEIGCCYGCGAVFREMPGIASLEPFKLSLADYYRSLDRGASGS